MRYGAMSMRAPLTLLFTLTFVLSPLVTEPFSGFRADQLPIPQIEPPVQPAGYAFAIWGLIYAWLVLSAGFGMLKRQRSGPWDRGRGPLIVSLALGTPWLWVANQSAVWATVLIIAMAAGAVAAVAMGPREDRLWFRGPVSVYAGWLTAASFVSLGSTAAGYGVLTDAQGWAYLGIGLALVTALAVQWRLGRAPLYGLTVVWALVGIVVANGVSGVAGAAGVGIVTLLGLMAWQRQRDLAARA